MKPLDFEDFYSKPELPMSVKDRLHFYWNAARVGMVPEDSAIKLPDLSQWPKDAEGVVVLYSGVGDGCATYLANHSSAKSAVIKYILRPAPAWVPNLGETVLINIDQIRAKSEQAPLGTFIGVVSSMEIPNNPCVRLLDGSYRYYLIEQMKPYSPDKVGKPWNEI